MVDHSCNSRLDQALNINEAVDSDVELTTSAEQDGSGRWIISVKTLHPPVGGVSGYQGVFVGAEFVCQRDAQTGAVLLSEEFLLAIDGERILAWRETDQQASWVDELPQDISDLYRELLTRANN